MIVYLHGLASAGTSEKATWLRARLAPIRVESPTYPAHLAAEAAALLTDYLDRRQRDQPTDRRLLLIGSSLGGFWAQYLAPRFGAGLVLINPSLRPFESLARYLGVQTSYARGEKFSLDEAHLRAFEGFRLERCIADVPTLVLLDEGDEVLDYRVAEAFYRGCGRTIVYPGGSHRFEHLTEALPEIRRLYAALPAATDD